MSRYFDNDDDFYRYDFTLKDLNSAAKWAVVAREMNKDAKADGDETRMQVCNRRKN